MSDFSKAIQINPNGYSAYFFRGGVYDRLKQYWMAIDDYSKVIEFNPNNNEEAYFFRGIDYLRLRECISAMSDFDKVIQLKPNDAMAYYYRGKCHQALGHNSNAQADFLRARALGYNC